MWPWSDGSKTRQPVLKGWRERRRRRATPVLSWHYPEILPTKLPSPGRQAPWSRSLCTNFRDVNRRAQLSKDRRTHISSHDPPPPSNATPPHAFATAPCTCRHFKLKARCSNSTQLECCTGANNQARFMRKEAPISSPLAGIKSQTNIRSGAPQSWMLPRLRLLPSIKQRNQSASGSLHHLPGLCPPPPSHTTGERQNPRGTNTLERDPGSFRSVSE